MCVCVCREREAKKWRLWYVYIYIYKFYNFFELLRDVRNSYYDYFNKKLLFLILDNSYS